MVEYHAVSTPPIWQESFAWIFFRYALVAGRIWNFGCRHWGARQNCLDESKKFDKSTPRQYQPVKSEDLREELQRNSDGSQPAETKEDAEARNDFWRLHLSPSRWTQRSLLCAERRIIPNTTEIDWRDQDNSLHSGCVAGTTNRRLLECSRRWRCWKRNLLQDFCGPGSDLWRSKQLPDRIFLLPEIWIDMSKAAKKKGKQEWANEKTKFDNARRLRGTYFIDPDDGRAKERPSKSKERNWKLSRKRLCFARWWQESVLGSYGKLWRVRTPILAKKQSMLALWKLTNPQGNEWNVHFWEITRTTSLEKKGFANLYRCPKRRKFWMRKLQWLRNGTSSKRSLRGRWIRQRTRKMFSLKHKKRISPLCYIDGHLSSQKCRAGTKAPKVQRSTRAPRRHRKIWPKCTRGVHRTRIVSLANDCCKSKDVVARLPGCAGQAANAVSVYTQVKMKDAST